MRKKADVILELDIPGLRARTSSKPVAVPFGDFV